MLPCTSKGSTDSDRTRSTIPSDNHPRHCTKTWSHGSGPDHMRHVVLRLGCIPRGCPALVGNERSDPRVLELASTAACGCGVRSTAGGLHGDQSRASSALCRVRHSLSILVSFTRKSSSSGCDLRLKGTKRSSSWFLSGHPPLASRCYAHFLRTETRPPQTLS